MVTDNPPIRGKIYLDAAYQLIRDKKKLTINAIVSQAGKAPGSLRESRYPEAFKQIQYLIDNQVVDKNKELASKLKEQKTLLQEEKIHESTKRHELEQMNLSLHLKVMELMSEVTEKDELIAELKARLAKAVPISSVSKS